MSCQHIVDFLSSLKNKPKTFGCFETHPIRQCPEYKEFLKQHSVKNANIVNNIDYILAYYHNKKKEIVFSKCEF